MILKKLFQVLSSVDEFSKYYKTLCLIVCCLVFCGLTIDRIAIRLLRIMLTLSPRLTSRTLFVFF